MKNFVSEPANIIVSAPANVVSGELVIVGGLIGVASTDALSGVDVNILTTGVFDMSKVSAQAWTAGVAIYYDAATKLATTTSSGNTLIGKALRIAANPSAVGRVRLNG